MKRSRIGCCVLALAALLGVASAGSAQMTGLENGTRDSSGHHLAHGVEAKRASSPRSSRWWRK